MRSLLKKWLKPILLSCFLFSFIFILPELALAQSAPDFGTNFAQNSGLQTSTDVRVIIANIIRIILGFLGTIAIVLILYAGFVYMTAGGDADKVDRAKTILRNAIIGLVIIASSYGIASFIISSLSQATGTGTDNGSTFGPGGSFPPGAADVFTVNDITPKGELRIKNVVARVAFNRNIEPASIRDKISIKNTDTGEEVKGSYSVNGSLVEFVPSFPCPEDNTRFCFGGDTNFEVLVSEGIVESQSRKTQQNAFRTDGQPNEGPLAPPAGFGDGQVTLICRSFGLEDNCRGTFKTGNFVDTLGPVTFIFDPVNGGGIPGGEPGASVDVQFRIDDNGGISHSKLFVEDLQTGNKKEEGLFSTGVTPSPLTISNALINWDTSGLVLQSRHAVTVESFDVDSNSRESNRVQTIVRPAHCFDGNLDTDKGELQAGPPDCGGPCGACPGSTCSDNSDCGIGLCLNGRCVSSPRILDVFPRDGAPGTLVTLYGTGFGKDKGKVRFLGGTDASDDVEAVYLTGACSDSWHEKFVIVEVPQGAQTGPIQIETSSGLTDDTANSIGILTDFELNNVNRPGICNISPDTEEVFNRVKISGKNFGSQGPSSATPKSIKFGTITATTPVWADTVLDQVKVPNVKAGETFVFVEVTGIQSNRVPFEVIQSATQPVIDFISPNSGPVKQYVTLFGSNFGRSEGSVEFLGSDGSVTIADVDFPQICQGKTWKGENVIIKVPNIKVADNFGEEILYEIRLKTSEGKISNSISFDLNTQQLTPGVCLLEPDNGPWDLDVTVHGEFFKDLNPSSSKVTYWDNRSGLDANVFSWKSEEVKTVVPTGSVTGPVTLVDQNGTLSNKVNFAVGTCEAGTCGDGLTCCSNGACQASCTVSKPVCSYSWVFSTGLGGPDWPCVDNQDCNCPANPTPDNPCLVCSPEGKCVSSCTQNSDCGDGGVCGCKLGPDGNQLCSCISKSPRVLEDPTCSEDTQTPTPYKNTQDACTNAVISARFSVDMDESTFVTGDPTKSTIIVKECNTGSSINVSSCIEIPGEIRVINEGVTGEGFSFYPGSVSNSQELKDNTWYQVTIKGVGSQDTSGNNPVIAVKGNSADGGIPMQNDYVWEFKTSSTCAADKVLVTPSRRLFTQGFESQQFSSHAVAANCNLIWVPGTSWKWAALNNQAPFVSLFDVFDENSNLISDRQNAAPSPLLANTPENDPVKIEASFCNQSGICPLGVNDTADIEVSIDSDTQNPRVIIQSECNINTQSPSPFMGSSDACVNAFISARFTKDMEDSSLLDPTNVQLKKCNTGTVLDTSSCGGDIEGVDNDGNGSPDPLEKVGADNDPGEGFVFEPSVTKLDQNTWYEVTILGGNSGMKSQDGFPMQEDFVWHFKTKDSSANCEVSRAIVTPPQTVLRNRDDKTNYFGNALAANCNILRGTFAWQWKTVNPENDTRAELNTVPLSNVPDPVLGEQLLQNFDFSNDDLSMWLPIVTDSSNRSVSESIEAHPILARDKVLKVTKSAIGAGSADGIYQENIPATGGVEYRFAIEYQLGAGEVLRVTLENPSDPGNFFFGNVSGTNTLTLTGPTTGFETFKREFTAPANASSFRLFLGANDSDTTNVLVNQISVRELIRSKGSIEAVAKQQTLPNDAVHVQGTVFPGEKSDTADLIISFDKPRIVKFHPNCQSACLNGAVGGFFNMKMDLDTVKGNLRLFKCTDDTCNSSIPVFVEDVANDITLDSGEVSYFGMNPTADNGLLDAEASYRAIVLAGPNGVKSLESVPLEGLNHDFDGDSIVDSFSWIFKTKNEVCVIDKINVSPKTHQEFLIGAEQSYVTEGFSPPDACDANGQAINPFTVDWSWLSTNNNVATITRNNLEPSTSPDTFVDPNQTATTTGPGDTKIQVSNIPQTAVGQADLTVTCGFRNDLDCPNSINEWGVSTENNCCYKRPRVLVPTGVFPQGSEPNNVFVSQGTQSPQPGINAGYSQNDPSHPNPANLPKVCRNGLVAAAFSEPIDIRTLDTSNIKISVDNGLLPCSNTGPVSFFKDLGNRVLSFFSGEFATAQSSNFCEVEGSITATNLGQNGLFVFTPEELLDQSKAYRVSINGGALDTQGVNIEGGIRSERGIEMAGDFVWDFLVKNEICEINLVDIQVAHGDAAPASVKRDFFSCALRDDCRDDVYSPNTDMPVVDNQHKYMPFSYDKDGQLVAATYSWVNSNPEVISICEKDSNCSYDLRTSGSTGKSANDDLTLGAASVTAIKNGQSVATVLATGTLPDSGSGSKSVNIEVFICENPWPDIGNFPFKDDGGNATNFSFFYCRDAGAPGTADDLPAMSAPVFVNPPITPRDIVTDPSCPSVADFKCGEDGQTYNNQCTIDNAGVRVLRSGVCDIGLVKEILFFVDVPDNVVRHDECTGPLEYMCGADGRTFFNRCVAQKEGIEIESEGKCK